MPAADPATYPQPPVRPPTWTSFTAESIERTVADSLAKSDAFLDSLVALAPADRTFDSVVRPLALHSGYADRDLEPALFLQYVSADKALRDASVAADKRVNDWSLEALMRKDVYDALLDAQRHTRDHAVQLNPEEQRLLDRLILERTRNGLGLDGDKRKKYLELKKRITTLEIEFQKNCNEEAGFMLFIKEELDGVPEDVISGYPVVEENGVQKYKVTHKTPDVFPLYKSAHLPSTRRRANLSYEAKTLQNVPLLREMVSLRNEAARLLGYANHAAWVLEIKMAKTPDAVDAFLADLEHKLRPLGLAERERLLALKREEHQRRGLPKSADDDQFFLWDYRYYDRLFVERELDLDEDAVKQYFPVAHVVPAVLGIYKDLLGVEIIPVPRTRDAGGETWHAEADMYAVWEGNRAGEEGAFLGYMHLDLFPRENKYGHAAVFPLLPSFVRDDGGREYPVVCMVANLAKPTPGSTPTMKHTDVVTFFHEMGHAYHGLLSKTQFAKFHGTAVARDFVEAPSQMLENWTWTPAELKRISSHSTTGAPLPDDLITKLIQSRNINQGLFNLRQIFFAKYDMLLHAPAEGAPELSDDEMSRLWCELREKTSLVTIGDEIVGGQSGFAHIAGGYSAGYYGYLWSQVFSADMFESVFAKDPMDRAAGQRYRREILQPGGSRDEMDSLVAFLGRKPTNDAFLKHLLGGAAQ
ncbi:metalloendopeptidase [Rhodotorula paludigena]|uniref:metalloendopeptidase n=1 Tax=Rhodotorula paludigena TaxID=86838 RepID=UPI00317F9246